MIASFDHPIIQTYRTLLALPDPDPTLHLYAACCLFSLGLYKEANIEAQKGPATRLQNRLLFQIAHKLGDETQLMSHHRNLTEATEDQLCLAAIHYLRAHFQNATDIYKRLLIENRENLALNGIEQRVRFKQLSRFLCLMSITFNSFMIVIELCFQFMLHYAITS